MEFVRIEPDANGKGSLVTFDMSQREMEILSTLLQEGKLAHLGITGASFAELNQTDSGARPWTKAERDKRATPKDAPKPKRR